MRLFTRSGLRCGSATAWHSIPGRWTCSTPWCCRWRRPFTFKLQIRIARAQEDDAPGAVCLNRSAAHPCSGLGASLVWWQVRAAAARILSSRSRSSPLMRGSSACAAHFSAQRRNVAASSSSVMTPLSTRVPDAHRFDDVRSCAKRRAVCPLVDEGERNSGSAAQTPCQDGSSSAHARASYSFASAISSLAKVSFVSAFASRRARSASSCSSLRPSGTP